MADEKDLPLCRECNQLESDKKAAQKELDTVESRCLEAEDALNEIQEKLDDHQGGGHTEEDDQFLLYQLAENAGQTRMF